MQIEKGIPLPSKRDGRPPKYPFAAMSVTDSFAAPAATKNEHASLFALATAWAKRNNPGAKFATRRVDDKTVRIWRVA